MAESDSAVVEAVPETPSTEPEGPTLGDDLFAVDSEAPAGPDDEGHSAEAVEPADAEAPAAEPDNNIDLLRTPVEQLPDHLKPLAPLAKNLQASFTRAQQDLRDQQQQAAQERQQYLEAVQRLQQVPQAPVQDPVQQLYEQLQPEERRGLDVVNQLVTHNLSPIQEQMQQIQQRMEQLQGGLYSYQQQQVLQRQQAINAEVQEARQLYGQDLDQWADGIAALRGKTNPTTGQPFSVREAYERLAGVTAQQAEQARTQDRAVRRQTQAVTRPQGAVGGGTDNGQPGSVNEAINELRKLGFE